MREFIKGVTKIRVLEGAEDGANITVYKQGVFSHTNTGGTPVWRDLRGVLFVWGVDVGEGKSWEFVEDTTESPQPTKVKSTGGSSNYYKITLPEWVIEKNKSQGFVMLEDLAGVMFDNDFNYVNVAKAQKRMFELEKGGGKEGNSFEYDATKSKYYIDKQVEVFNRK